MGCMTDRQTDGYTDGWMDGKSEIQRWVPQLNNEKEKEIKLQHNRLNQNQNIFLLNKIIAHII